MRLNPGDLKVRGPNGPPSERWAQRILRAIQGHLRDADFRRRADASFVGDL